MIDVKNINLIKKKDRVVINDGTCFRLRFSQWKVKTQLIVSHHFVMHKHLVDIISIASYEIE
jgi:hypothetical protein